MALPFSSWRSICGWCIFIAQLDQLRGSFSSSCFRFASDLRTLELFDLRWRDLWTYDWYDLRSVIHSSCVSFRFRGFVMFSCIYSGLPCFCRLRSLCLADMFVSELLFLFIWRWPAAVVLISDPHTFLRSGFVFASLIFCIWHVLTDVGADSDWSLHGRELVVDGSWPSRGCG